MAEIATIAPNGFKVVSTFSGCGGSCLGYRMAGFRVVWANEFIVEAAKTYKANHPESILDTRDIRRVKPEEILAATKLQPGELDLLDGSPPCASFSTAGKKEAGWGLVKKYSDSEQRTDDLFFEFVRILRGLRPKTFVAENVSGLVKGSAKGYFLEILGELKKSGYRVEAKLLDAQWLGVPQARQRIIFVGVRDDLGLKPAHPTPLSYRYTVRDALPWITAVRGGNKVMGGDTLGLAPYQFEVEAETNIDRFAIGEEWDRMGKPGTTSEKYRSLVRPALDKPCSTVTCPPNGSFSPSAPSSSASVVHPTEKRKFSIAELRRICAFPDDFILTGSYAQQWERLGRSVPPIMMRAIASTVRDQILNGLPTGTAL
jgi:DNA (cytosine-5)-methyltransferase 1